MVARAELQLKPLPFANVSSLFEIDDTTLLSI